MSVNEPQFPNWDGLTPTLHSRLDDKSPDYETADQYTAEILAVQSFVVSLDAALNPVPYTRGGTGLTFLGTPLQVLRTNASGTAIEWATVSGGSSTENFDAENQESFTVPKFTPVYTNALGKFKRASSTGLPQVVGFTIAAVLASTSGTIQTDGVLTGSTAEWDAITGDSGGLTPGPYYLTVDGTMSHTALTTGYIVRLGQALTDVDFEISIEPPVRL